MLRTEPPLAGSRDEMDGMYVGEGNYFVTRSMKTSSFRTHRARTLYSSLYTRAFFPLWMNLTLLMPRPRPRPRGRAPARPLAPGPPRPSAPCMWPSPALQGDVASRLTAE